MTTSHGKPAPGMIARHNADLSMPLHETSQAANELTARVEELDRLLAAYGERYGIPFRGWYITAPLPDRPIRKDLSAGKAVAGALFLGLVEAVRVIEEVTIELHQGRWRLVYHRGTAVNPDVSVVPLRDAPLQARERFLLRADDFVTKVQAHYDAPVARLRAAAEKGDAAIARLRESVPKPR